jgi:hypothetical protein
MSLEPASPDKLLTSPELACLEVLDAAADAAHRALLAAHLDLAEGDAFLEEVHVTPEQCLAAALFSAIELLTTAIERYRLCLARTEQRPATTSHDPF